MKNTKKSLCIDARMLKNSGIGVYIQHYTLHILASNLFETTLIGKKEDLIDAFSDYDNWEFIDIDVPIYSIAEQYLLPIKIPKCDVFWAPHYNIPLLPTKAKKYLVTIPDAAHLALGDEMGFGFIKKLYAKIVFRAATLKADIITTISDFSKSEIVKFTSTKPSKIHTIHLGIDTNLFRPIDNESLSLILEKYKLPENFILFVGNVKPNKNLRGLINAFNLIKNKIPGYKIVIVGKKDGFITGDKELFTRIEDLGISSRIHFTGFVETEDLPKIYNLAAIFAFPSLYEGFGFPPLEAMACGTAVVSSERASMPEICGNAAQYAEINNEQDFADKLLMVIQDNSLRNSLILEGYKQVKNFTWKESAEKLINIIRQM